MIFSVIDRVLLRPLPFPDSDRIMRLQRHFPNGDGPSVSIPKFMAWKQSHAFQSMAAYDFGSVGMNLGAGDRRDPVNAVHVTAGFFDVFGVKPILGRTFSVQEDLPKAGKFASHERYVPPHAFVHIYIGLGDNPAHPRSAAGRNAGRQLVNLARVRALGSGERCDQCLDARSGGGGRLRLV